MSWLIIGTWKFALPGVKIATEILKNRGGCLDAVEKAVQTVEANPRVFSVGLGAIPNIKGEVEVDAAIMDGRNLCTGAVAGIKNYLHAISIARKVMIETKHNLLVGEGAEEFAKKIGFKKTNLLTERGLGLWQKRMAGKRRRLIGHDTIGVVALDQKGNMACGTSSSGLALKLRSRVGDSAIVGAGFYADNKVGGAAATGVGESIMKGCLCFHAVELMRRGYHPNNAAEIALRHIHKRLHKANFWPGKMALVCADKKGNYGGAANHPYFFYAVASNTIKPKLIKVKPVKRT